MTVVYSETGASVLLKVVLPQSCKIWDSHSSTAEDSKSHEMLRYVRWLIVTKVMVKQTLKMNALRYALRLYSNITAVICDVYISRQQMLTFIILYLFCVYRYLMNNRYVSHTVITTIFRIITYGYIRSACRQQFVQNPLLGYCPHLLSLLTADPEPQRICKSKNIYV
jgi:hypothetical protein